MQTRKDVSKFKGSALFDDKGDPQGDSRPNFLEVTDLCRKLAGQVCNRQVAARELITAMDDESEFKHSLLDLVASTGASARGIKNTLKFFCFCK